MEMVLPDDKVKWLSAVQKNIHKDETFRLHFMGVLWRDMSKACCVLIYLPERLKFRRGSSVSRTEYERRRYIGSLYTLPFWKKIHKKEEFIMVDFEAEIVDYSNGIFTARLPDSYMKEGEPEE